MPKNKNLELKPPKSEEKVVKDGKVKKKKSTPDVQKNKEAVKAVVKETPKTELSKSTTLSEKDLAKIQKKKAKKLAQKLKKKEKKNEPGPKASGEVKPATNGPSAKKNAKVTKNSDKTKKTKPVAVVEAKTTSNESPSKKQKKIASKKAKAVANDKKDRVPKERDPEAEASTVFIGNLPVNTKRVQLVRLLEPYGGAKSIRLRTAGGKVLFKHKQRKEAGSLNAYVVLESKEKVDQALALNGTEFKDHILRVTRSSKESINAAESDAKRTIFVGNLKYSATEDKLREIFSSCGDIEYIRCLQDGEKGCKGVAYVCFKAPDAVGLAIELNETVLDDRPIHVERYSVKKLGAKAARDAESAAAGTKTQKKTKKTGEQKRIDKKAQSNGNAEKSTSPAKKKKSEFRGVKTDGVKKIQKKKKVSGALQNLAKKIAPKPK